MRHDTGGDAPMSRRRAIITGLTTAGALLLPGCADDAPPTYGSILRMSDNLTWRAQRLLVARTARVKEYDVRDISSFPSTGTANPADASNPFFDPEHGPTFDRLRAGGFADWRVEIVGRVARPGAYSLAALKRFPAQVQVTRHACEEGWSAIAQWTGARLGDVLLAAGVLPDARWVNFVPFDMTPAGIDMFDAFHPQTLLAYQLNGRDLPLQHGAPVRARVATQLGWKSIKFLRRIEVLDRFEDNGSRGEIQNGWSWYGGI